MKIHVRFPKIHIRFSKYWTRHLSHKNLRSQLFLSTENQRFKVWALICKLMQIFQNLNHLISHREVRKNRVWGVGGPKMRISKGETAIWGSQNRVRRAVHPPLFLAQIDSKGGVNRLDIPWYIRKPVSLKIGCDYLTIRNAASPRKSIQIVQICTS